MEFYKFIFQAWKVMKVWVMKSHGKAVCLLSIKRQKDQKLKTQQTSQKTGFNSIEKKD